MNSLCAFNHFYRKRAAVVLILYSIKYENNNERNVFRYKSWIDVTVQLWTHTINSSVTKSSVRAARPAQLQVRSGNLFLRKKREEEKKLKCMQTDLYANNAGLLRWLMASLSAHFRSNKHRNVSFSSLRSQKGTEGLGKTNGSEIPDVWSFILYPAFPAVLEC